METWTARVATVGKKAANGVARTLKPAIRTGCRVVRDYPEVAVFGGIGYAVGKFLDDLPVIGRLTGKNGKWVLGAAGAVYGYNKALIRRMLRNAEARVHANVEGKGDA